MSSSNMYTNAPNIGFISFPCLRSLVLLFNIMFFISGLSIVWMGIWMKTDFECYLRISSQYTKFAPFVLIVVGTIILFVTSLACSCIVKINPPMLVIYGGFLIAMIFTLISLSIYVHSYKDLSMRGVSIGVKKAIRNSGTENANTTSLNVELIDFVQGRLHCCGNQSYLDWPSRIAPESCCIRKSTLDNICVRNKPRDLYKVGCATKLRHLINTYLTVMGVTVSAIALLPLFGTVLTFALAMMVNKTDYEVIA